MNTKKLLLFLVALLAFGGVKSANYNYTDTSGIVWSYIPSGSNATLTCSSRSFSGAVVVPSTVSDGTNTYTVTSLGSNCFASFSQITAVTIPETVTSLGSSCFEGCSSLESVTIPEGVTSIGNNCFHGCSSLQTATIPASVTSFGSYCFYNCSSLQTLTFMGTPETIAGYSFLSSSTSTVNIPIGSSSFFKEYLIILGSQDPIKETVVAIGQTGYATICSRDALSFSGTGVTAYAGSLKTDGSELRVLLSEVAEAAAGEGLVVKAEPGYYVMNTPASSPSLLGESNILKGVKSGDTQLTITPDDNCYALRSYDDGSLAFAKIVNTLTFPYGRAYLQLTESQSTQQLAVSFGETATGIGTVDTDQTEDNAYYNLQGIRVSQPTRGIYIRNGKKVFVK